MDRLFNHEPTIIFTAPALWMSGSIISFHPRPRMAPPHRNRWVPSADVNGVDIGMRIIGGVAVGGWGTIST